MGRPMQAPPFAFQGHSAALPHGTVIAFLLFRRLLLAQRLAVLFHLAAVGQPFHEHVFELHRMIDCGLAVFVEVQVVPQLFRCVLLCQLPVDGHACLHACEE